MADRVLRAGELVKYRLSDRSAWKACEVEAVWLRHRGNHRALQIVDAVNLDDLDDDPDAPLVWFRYSDRMGRATVLVSTRSAQGSVGAHELRVPGDGMISAEVWSSGQTWKVRLWEGGKVRIDPVILDSKGAAQILLGHLRPDGTLAMDYAIENLPPELLEDTAWALDFQMGGPRLRRTAPQGQVAPSAAPDPTPRHATDAGEAERVTLRDLLGRLGMPARAARLKDATVDDLRAELLAVLKGEALTRLTDERQALVTMLRRDDVGALTADDGDNLHLGMGHLVQDLQTAREQLKQAMDGSHAERMALAGALGVELPEGELALPPLLAGIQQLKAQPTADAGGFELTAPTIKPKGRPPAVAPDVAVRVAVRDALLDVLCALGGDGETMGINGADAAEIQREILAMGDLLAERGQAQALLEVLGRNGVDAGVRAGLTLEQLQAEVDTLVHVLLPEVEIACPHCQGGLLISSDLLRPEGAE